LASDIWGRRVLRLPTRTNVLGNLRMALPATGLQRQPSTCRAGAAAEMNPTLINWLLGVPGDPSRVSPPGLSDTSVLEPDDLAAADRLRDGAQRILGECSKVIVGQKDVLEQLLIALFAQGHCLLVGVPGLAKTLMIRTLADAMDLSFSRVQF